MLYFQTRPDRVFLAILQEALQYARGELDVAPTHEDDATDEYYRVLYPGLPRFFARGELVEVLDRLLQAQRQPAVYEISDFHWLVLHECLEVFCDLHNDAALDRDGQVGPYAIDTIDLEVIVERFFWDIDFQWGSVLLEVEERAPGRVQASRQAWKIAAGLRPDPEDLRMAVIPGSAEEIWPADPDERPMPESGYVGPYPRLEPDATR